MKHETTLMLSADHNTLTSTEGRVYRAVQKVGCEGCAFKGEFKCLRPPVDGHILVCSENRPDGVEVVWVEDAEAGQ